MDEVVVRPGDDWDAPAPVGPTTRAAPVPAPSPKETWEAIKRLNDAKIRLEDVGADTLLKAYQLYLFSDNTPKKIAETLSIDEGLVTEMIDRLGWLNEKRKLVYQLQTEEKQRYLKFLVEKRVPTAILQQRASESVVTQLQGVVDKLGGLEGDDLEAALKSVQPLVRTLRTLSDALDKAALVGSRAVNLGTLGAGVESMLAAGGDKPSSSGKQPLVSLNFNVSKQPSDPHPIVEVDPDGVQGDK